MRLSTSDQAKKADRRTGWGAPCGACSADAGKPDRSGLVRVPRLRGFLEH
jgi:hypothetical protein